MAELFLDIEEMNNQIDRFKKYAESLSNVADSLAYVSEHLEGNGTLGEWGYDEQVNKQALRVGGQSDYLVYVVNMLLKVIETYKNYEKKAGVIDHYGSLGDFMDGNYNYQLFEELTALQTNEKGETTFSESSHEWLYAEGKHGMDWGAYTAGRENDGSLSGHSGGLGYKGEFHGALRKDSYKSCIAGLYCTSGEASFVAVDAEVGGRVSVIHDDKDGNSRKGPSINVAGSASVNAVKSKAETKIGTKHFNVDYSAEVNLLGADVGAEAYLGPGGAYWKGKYDTHVVQIKATESLTILGSTGSVSATVNAGGINGTLGAGAKGPEANVSVGAGMLAGAEIELGVNVEGTTEIAGAAKNDYKETKVERDRIHRWGL